MLLFSTAMAATLDCPPFGDWLDNATQNLTGGDVEEARTALQNAETAMICALIPSEQLAHYWLLVGAVAWLEARQDEAALAFAAAKHLKPGYFPDFLGAELRVIYDQTPAGAMVQLSLDPADLPAWLDGTPQSAWPMSVESGWHLLQIIEAEQVRYGKTLLIPAGADVVVQPDLQPMITDIEAPERHAISVPWLVSASALALGSGMAAIYTTTRTDDIKTASTIDAAQQAYSSQRAAFFSAIGLGGAAATCLVLSW